MSLTFATYNDSQVSITHQYHEINRALLGALERAGVFPADPGGLINGLIDGQLVRFATARKPRKKNGYLIAFFDQDLPNVVIAGDRSLDVRITWSARRSVSLSKTQRLALKNRMQEARKVREKERNAEQAEAVERASKIWDSCDPADHSHPYLVRKRIAPYRARQSTKSLVLDIRDFDGRLKSLQFIRADGSKKLLAKGAKQGNFIPVYVPSSPSRILVCEGWATGCSLASLSPNAVVLAAIDAGNLRAVATGARNHWPNADLIVCGDDDRQTPGNPGATAARQAAVAAGADYALPAWPPESPSSLSDYNDLVNWLRRDK